MTRPTRVYIDSTALLHNVRCVKSYARGKDIIAMVKANAYGCGLAAVLPVLDGQVNAFGVASLEEAMKLRNLGSRSECVLFQGVFGADELYHVASQRLQCVIHQKRQLQWILDTPLPQTIRVWVKVNTGMHRLGFFPNEVPNIMAALLACPWVDKNIGLMTHLACADEPSKVSNQQQLQTFQELSLTFFEHSQSIANSAAIMALPESHADVVRPGIMLYGVSPFAHSTGRELGLMPVMHFISSISAIHRCPPASPVGYGGIWQSDKSSIIGIVPVGYGDGYPRHVSQASIWVNGFMAPVVGRVSMDMLMIDLTHCPNVQVGDAVELWGRNIPVEHVARAAGTIAYELLCQVSPRVRL
ncbi:alanine racemase [Legionella oakridgensis]|nr:alanine racemase [Legionella oakridgensis]ETO93006.1 alanine racemase [Legionella oakridgensis RV-2-2007]KTD43534.1 alanine racemase [Legionella oakridgensis]STY20526.1 alanine racemase [Legionella longbeachae]